jgi:hypothetical protein
LLQKTKRRPGLEGDSIRKFPPLPLTRPTTVLNWRRFGLDLIRVEDKSGDFAFKRALVRDALYHSLLTEAELRRDKRRTDT